MKIDQFILELINIQILVQIGIGIGLILFLLVIDITTTTRRIIKRAKHNFNDENEKLKEIEHQFSIIKSLAPTYINSLGKTGSDLLKELDTIIYERGGTLAQIEALIKDNDINDLLDLLEEENKLKNKKSYRWEVRAETIIRELGSKISQASNLASQLGVPKSKSRREGTQLSLIQAKIIPNSVE
jgi:hypothetical protein